MSLKLAAFETDPFDPLNSFHLGNSCLTAKSNCPSGAWTISFRINTSTDCDQNCRGKCRGYWAMATVSIQNSLVVTSVRAMLSEYSVRKFDSHRTRNASSASGSAIFVT